MEITKDNAKECLETLYTMEGKTASAKVLYDNLNRYIEQTDVSNVKETKEYKDMERQEYLANQLCAIYKARLKKIDNIIAGRYDK